MKNLAICAAARNGASDCNAMLSMVSSGRTVGDRVPYAALCGTWFIILYSTLAFNYELPHIHQPT
jgi:hypothetical protein